MSPLLRGRRGREFLQNPQVFLPEAKREDASRKNCKIIRTSHRIGIARNHRGNLHFVHGNRLRWTIWRPEEIYDSNTPVGWTSCKKTLFNIPPITRQRRSRILAKTSRKRCSGKHVESLGELWGVRISTTNPTRRNENAGEISLFYLFLDPEKNELQATRFTLSATRSDPTPSTKTDPVKLKSGQKPSFAVN